MWHDHWQDNRQEKAVLGQARVFESDKSGPYMCLNVRRFTTKQNL